MSEPRPTIYVSIGNSDDKLTQLQWSCFVNAVDSTIRAYSNTVHGYWLSAPDSQWQNACWCFELGDARSAFALRRYLRLHAHHYSQESIAWAVAKTELLEAWDDAGPESDE